MHLRAFASALVGPEGGPADDILMMHGGSTGPEDTVDAQSFRQRRLQLIRNIREHRYTGEDRSLLYKYVLSPLAAYLTEMTPRALHPNAITLLGVAATAVGFAAVMATTIFVRLPWSASSAFPAWLHLLLGLCFFAYQTLDNMDGKQARRTGTSSPLGYVVDHGCDAINSTIGTLNLFVNLNVATYVGGDHTMRRWASLKQWMLWETVAVGFFFNTWEEYHTGSLVLPVVNGASEGLTLLSCIAIVSAVRGDAWWEEEAPISRSVGTAVENSLSLPPDSLVGIKNNTCVVALLGVACAFTIIGQLAKVYGITVARSSRAKRDGEESDDGVVVGRFSPFVGLLPFLVTNAMVLAWRWCATSSERLLEGHSTLLFIFCGCFHSRLTILLMVSHVCGVAYRPLTPTTMVTIVSLSALLFIRIACPAVLAMLCPLDSIVLVLLLILNAYGLFVLCWRTVIGMCFALNTSMFGGRSADTGGASPQDSGKCEFAETSSRNCKKLS